jgi:hypothetical protein
MVLLKTFSGVVSVGIRNMLQRIFQGRYGIDNLSFFIFVIAAILLQFKYIWILGAALIAYGFYRAFSKNRNKRYLELQQYNKAFIGLRHFMQPLLNKAGVVVARFQQRKHYAFVRCPKCRRTLRLPKNKGRLQVTCPVCRFEFIKKT